MNYGMPYMGSKSKIVPSIAAMLPAADNFYDLFGGGFSVSHYMIAKKSHKYKNFIYNDIISGNAEIIRKAINGEFNYDVFKPNFISREEFFDKKDVDQYIALIWSFGNNQKSYLFSKEIEPYKKSLHDCIVFDQFDEFSSKNLGFSRWPDNIKSINKRRLLVCQSIISSKLIKNMQQLERLQQLEGLDNIQLFNLDYKDVIINTPPEETIVYLDPPYRNTAGYIEGLNYDELDDYFRGLPYLAFMSEYQTPFNSILEIKKVQLFNNSKVQRTYAIEKLFINQ